ncbi:23S rRNA (adenine(2503)-C(2))-methyltransferase RlmN [Acetivibrio mesophilus]|uniref:Probable dual-specificity RNA methyltransferase RlmN n=1 Tax=Acetivibrio mesophilus TaxID=2487273 RepID=A0A4Q0I854_9FIRM|nr:23S rRNA (adenine(2503)-C(2))-methyltransferase RlmN [Acetivibrio mesophilus]ODM25600.1 23S rRNA (adenine(2503)-C(2))-methyltransferase [Clostridium sp. Bc-iso-3]RXE60187.1 23S rRNA (adenine(2503)-C(2))-methyltransferase RlmN [Acetivibrio mesophilus]
MDGKIDLLSMTIEELENMLTQMGHQKFRAKQIFQWTNKGIKDIDGMSNLSKDLREQLKERAYINRFEIIKKFVSNIDGTAKYLFRLGDGNIIESVLMKYSHGYSACISSQVGCKMGCKFCASTGAGFVRNLTSGEMLDQILTIQNDTKERIGNVVIMGIGEPLDNYENVVKFLRLINHKDGVNLGARHISVSTCGLVPEVLRLAEEKIPVTLSISLHAPNDTIREKIMPVNKRYSIDKIIEACKIYTEATNRRITFEYAMINGLNDSKENALELAGRIRGMLCHVNLIPINTVSDTGFKRSSKDKIAIFKEILERYGVETTVRRELGSDINAACGQLRRSLMDEGQLVF